MAVFQFAEGGAVPSAMHFSGKGETFPVQISYGDDEDDGGVNGMAEGGMPSYAAPPPFPSMSGEFSPYAENDRQAQPPQAGLAGQPPVAPAGLGSYQYSDTAPEKRPYLGTTPQQNSPYTLGVPQAASHTAQAPASTPLSFARGGVASATSKVKGAGRYGDTEIVHMNKEELEELKQMWGPPTINPETGQPEFFLKKLWKTVKKVAPIASLFIPVIGPAVGTALAGAAGAVGLGSLAAGIGANSALVGSALTGAALGGASGGAKGAIIGGIGGGLSAPAQVKGGASFAQKLGGKLGIKDPNLAGKVVGIGGGLLTGALVNSLSKSGGGGSTMQNASGAPAVGLGGLGSSQLLPSVPNYNQTILGSAPAAEPFRIASIDYNRRGFKSGGNVDRKDDDMMKHLVEYSRNGGHLGPGQVKGIGSGQEDKIPAWLSDGEYVWSAQDVADLGDGSTNEGVRRLDKMRQMVRKQAGRKDVKKIAKPQRGIDHMLKAVGGMA
jgi:hypothetical protein